MKKLILPLLFALVLPATFSCSSSRLSNYVLTEEDAQSAIRELLSIGARDTNYANAFNKDAMMAAVFPESLRKVLNTLNQLGLTPEVDRFTNTLATAAQTSVQNAIPVFVNGITGMRLSDAISIVKGGGTSATDYLRSHVGSDLRVAIRPAMQQALDQYKLNEQWNKIVEPAKALVGNKLNLDLANLMAGIVSEKMFEKMGQKELEIRSNTSAQTTPLLRKVFGRSW
ncbi:MAG: hypothetical protein C4330_12300 [Chitinophagaceae bacterium]